MMAKLNTKALLALDALTGEVSREYSEAMEASNRALLRVYQAERALKVRAIVARRVLHRYIRQRLKLAGTEWVEFSGEGYLIEHDKRPEKVVPYISLRIYCEDRIAISVDFNPRTQGQLDEIIDRVRDAVAAQRKGN